MARLKGQSSLALAVRVDMMMDNRKHRLPAREPTHPALVELPVILATQTLLYRGFADGFLPVRMRRLIYGGPTLELGSTLILILSGRSPLELKCVFIACCFASD